jgi:hypothetical protein
MAAFFFEVLYNFIGPDFSSLNKSAEFSRKLKLTSSVLQIAKNLLNFRPPYTL